MNLFEKILKTIRAHALLDASTPALLMVSGGSDSTALAYLSAHLREEGFCGPLAMVHVNHNLRGEASDADAAFVQRLALGLEIPLTVVDVDVQAQAEAEHGNIEDIGRRERYAAAHSALSHLCLEHDVPTGQGRILVAHTVDDRIENFYMRSIVGTGPGGFRSMLYRNGNVVRPLLDCNREELREYIRARHLEDLFCTRNADDSLWCEDATNAHTDRFRTFVRHEIVPLAKTKNPNLNETLARTMNLIADEDDMLDEMANELVSQHVMWLEPVDEGCILSPWLAAERLPLQRRVAIKVLEDMLGADTRLESATVDAVLAAFANGKPVSGYVANIQGNLAVSANRNGVRIEPMAIYRMRRNRV